MTQQSIIDLRLSILFHAGYMTHSLLVSTRRMNFFLSFADILPDLFLIQPPAGSEHVAVNPAHIIISGDSAGGGLSLALLQVIRDSGLPLPAGGVLISPWCDLMHSFSSVHQNTKTVSLPVFLSPFPFHGLSYLPGFYSGNWSVVPQAQHSLAAPIP